MRPRCGYRTGDVVLLVNAEDDIFEFEWWGRRHECVLAHVNDVPTWILGCRPVFDWLALQPLVARYPYRTYLRSVTSLDFDLPCVSLSSEPDSDAVGIDIGVRVNPWFEPEAIQRLTQDLWTALKTMVATPPQQVRVRLSFRHFYRPDMDLHTLGDAHNLQLPAKLLSSPVPTLRYRSARLENGGD